MASYKEKPGTTLKQLMENNRYCKPDAVFCDGVRSDIKKCLDNPVIGWECTSGIIYVYTTAK